MVPPIGSPTAISGVRDTGVIITQVDQARKADDKAWRAIVLGTDPSLAETLLARMSTYRQLLYLRLAEGPLRLGHTAYESATLWSKYPKSCENRAGFSFGRAQVLRHEKGSLQLQFFLKQAKIRCLFLAKFACIYPYTMNMLHLTSPIGYTLRAALIAGLTHVIPETTFLDGSLPVNTHALQRRCQAPH